MSELPVHLAVAGDWPDDARWDDDRYWSDHSARPSLLPANATALERALEAVAWGALDLPVRVADLWFPDRCPEPFLPFLAWAFSVDEWDAAWPDWRKREAIAASVDLHRQKGTVWAVRRALAVAGYGDATLVERFGIKFLDGAFDLDGAETLAPPDHWAEYRVILKSPVTIRQAARAAAVITTAAPARCHLKALDFVEAAWLLDGSVALNGDYTMGVISGYAA